MLKKQKKKSKQNRSKNKNHESYSYLFNPGKIKSLQKKTNCSKLSNHDVRQIQTSMLNFKKNKNPSNRNNKKLKIDKNSTTNFTKTQMEYFNSRHFTQLTVTKAPSKGKQKPQQKHFSHIPFTQIMKNHMNIVLPQKGRLSLNNNRKKKRDLSGSKFTATNKSTLCQEVEQTYLQKERRVIKQMVQKSLIKKNIQRSQLLKITEKYEKLIDKIVNHEKINKNDINQADKYLIIEKQNFENQLSYQISQDTVRQSYHNQPVKPLKKQICPNLSLGNLRKLKIDDYDDEFMSHYDQLSQSWKRDLAMQKRY